jgi:AcrR family transcriptional regulator
VGGQQGNGAEAQGARVRDSTRERIREAAITLFHRQGFNATSLRQIADEVGIQVGSLYNHIASKEALLLEIMRDVLLELIEDTEREMAAAGPVPLDRVLAFFRTSIRFHTQRREQTFIGNTELRGLSAPHREEIVRLRDHYEGLLRDALTAWRDAGGEGLEDVRLAARIGTAVFATVAVWYRPDGRLTVEDLQRLLPPLFGPLGRAAAVPAPAA